MAHACSLRQYILSTFHRTGGSQQHATQLMTKCWNNAIPNTWARVFCPSIQRCVGVVAGMNDCYELTTAAVAVDFNFDSIGPTVRCAYFHEMKSCGWEKQCESGMWAEATMKTRNALSCERRDWFDLYLKFECPNGRKSNGTFHMRKVELVDANLRTGRRPQKTIQTDCKRYAIDRVNFNNASFICTAFGLSSDKVSLRSWETIFFRCRSSFNPNPTGPYKW